ncbi:MAG: WD40/YVTN/BNR-like repeat-containing protein, partial [Bryobacteraceae bacterium]
MRLASLVLITCLAQAEDRWVLQFFHDKDDSQLSLNDIAFATPERGVAVGYLTEKERVKPVAVVTSDGGAQWSIVPTKEIGVSVFFFDVTSGWMVTEEGIWFTDEAGRSWRKLHDQRGLQGVYFTTRERGWAVGARKTILETRDAGKTWTRLKAANDPKTSGEYTTYN